MLPNSYIFSLLRTGSDCSERSNADVLLVEPKSSPSFTFSSHFRSNSVSFLGIICPLLSYHRASANQPPKPIPGQKALSVATFTISPPSFL